MDSRPNAVTTSRVWHAYEPHAEAYPALKAKLAEFQAGQRGSDKPRIPNGPSLKIGMRDERVPLLRSRLDVAGESGVTYDKVTQTDIAIFRTELSKNLRNSSGNGCTLSLMSAETLSHGKP